MALTDLLGLSSAPRSRPRVEARAPSRAPRSEVTQALPDGFDTMPHGVWGNISRLWDPYPKYEAKVNDVLIRGSKLDDQSEYATLRHQGVKAMVDLTAEGTLDEELATPNGLRLLNLKIIDNTPPTVEQMEEFLRFVTNPDNQPCYVHCRAGVGRTGVAVAVYRMAVEGWSADRAKAEAFRYRMDVPSQYAFIEQFGALLEAGRIPGYGAARAG